MDGPVSNPRRGEISGTHTKGWMVLGSARRPPSLLYNGYRGRSVVLTTHSRLALSLRVCRAINLALLSKCMVWWETVLLPQKIVSEKLINIQLDKYHCPNKYTTLLLPLGRQKSVKITYRSEKIGGICLIALTSIDSRMEWTEKKISNYKLFAAA